MRQFLGSLIVLQVRTSRLRGLFSRSSYRHRYTQFLGKLKQARVEAGLTQVEVAHRLKRPQSFVSKIESGERRVDVVELNELARLYGKPLDFFVLS
jgi:hypothetical protein